MSKSEWNIAEEGKEIVEWKNFELTAPFTLKSLGKAFSLKFEGINL